MCRMIAAIGLLLCSVHAAHGGAAQTIRTSRGAAGPYAKWGPIEIPFPGPAARARGHPNPFSIRLDVTFVSPRGRRYRVPGFYDGDGEGGRDGNVWKVRFAADEIGVWTYASESATPTLDGHVGRFTVTAPSPDAKGFYRWGRLEAVGTASNRVRYLKFRDGPHWLKAGCDDPEKFLGRAKHYNTPEKRRAAVDYLARRGIHSLYIMTHNLGGARAFMESLPFWTMEPANGLVESGKALCLARSRRAHALYLPEGGSVSIHLAP